MSRFHDEFFRQGSPAHDALMIKCLSKAGIEKILSTVDIATHVTSAHKKPQEIVVCQLVGGRCAYVGKLEDNVREGYHRGHQTVMCHKIWDGKCKYSREDQCIFENSHWNPECKPVQAFIPSTVEIINVDQKAETEALVKNGTFIIGYADAIIDLAYNINVSYQLDDNWRMDGGSFQPRVRVLVEAKPKITSIGEVIRQIKTYKDIIQQVRTASAGWVSGGYEILPVFPVIATYSKLQDDALEYLKNEGITVAVFEEDGA